MKGHPVVDRNYVKRISPSRKISPQNRESSSKEKMYWTPNVKRKLEFSPKKQSPSKRSPSSHRSGLFRPSRQSSKVQEVKRLQNNQERSGEENPHKNQPNMMYLLALANECDIQNNIQTKTQTKGTNQYSPYSLSPLSPSTIQLLNSKTNSPRKIATAPWKILEAPQIHDDYYLNLVDWSSQNILAVALGSAVFLWNAHTSKVTRLMNLEDNVTGISWTPNGEFLAVGTGKGALQLWDIQKKSKVRDFTSHRSRVGAISWNGNHFISSGSRDRFIFNQDTRAANSTFSRWLGHGQEVCGLKWSEGNQLASGGNDNKLLVWDKRTSGSDPLWKFCLHKAAVKAIAWNPHKRGILSSGGGTADRCIRFWNTYSGKPLMCLDTGSQVCNIAWSRNVNELVSTHGYSQHQIVIWDYPSMKPLVTLTGHTSRVLYLSVSPDGRTIVTGAGDETLRFWNVFPEAKRVQVHTDRRTRLDFNTIR